MLPKNMLGSAQALMQEEASPLRPSSARPASRGMAATNVSSTMRTVEIPPAPTLTDAQRKSQRKKLVEALKRWPKVNGSCLQINHVMSL